jgi:hypothetical protein
MEKLRGEFENFIVRQSVEKECDVNIAQFTWVPLAYEPNKYARSIGISALAAAAYLLASALTASMSAAMRMPPYSGSKILMLQVALTFGTLIVYNQDIFYEQHILTVFRKNPMSLVKYIRVSCLQWA